MLGSGLLKDNSVATNTHTRANELLSVLVSIQSASKPIRLDAADVEYVSIRRVSIIKGITEQKDLQSTHQHHPPFLLLVGWD